MVAQRRIFRGRAGARPQMLGCSSGWDAPQAGMIRLLGHSPKADLGYNRVFLTTYHIGGRVLCIRAGSRNSTLDGQKFPGHSGSEKE